MPKFVLFDVDGTLVGVDGASSRSLNRALKELTGITTGFHGVSFAGKTDFQIIREGLVQSGFEGQSNLLNALMDRYLLYLPEELSAGKPHMKAGVMELLHTLQGLEDIFLGLLTGNVEETARLKLKPFGLNRFFPVGAFGSDAEERNLLLPYAVRRLRQSESISVRYQDCVVIGDTPKDVECAHVHGASAIAVATGPYHLEQLKEIEADFVVSDLSNTRQIVAWIRRRAGEASRPHF